MLTAKIKIIFGDFFFRSKTTVMGIVRTAERYWFFRIYFSNPSDWVVEVEFDHRQRKN